MDHSRAQIIATVGPSTQTLSSMRILIERGVDLVRINFAHGAPEEHRRIIHNTRLAASEQGRQIPIIGDLAGPRRELDHIHEYDPGALSPLTERDIDTLAFAIEQDLDYIGLSYVGRTEDVEEVRQALWSENSRARIIAKIERTEALRNAADILDFADAIMVARGGLAHEVPLEQIPYIQNTLIGLANWAHKPVIVATGMLASMTGSSTPTRAEVSDVAYAIMSGADAVMLSEETAVGHYPVEAVEMMERIILEAERTMPSRTGHYL